MFVIFTSIIFSSIFLIEKFNILIQISLEFVPKDPIVHKSALVGRIAWHLTGDKPSPETMLTKFYNTHMVSQGHSELNDGLQ